MTVPSSVAKSGPYNCNGVTDVFNYDFRIVDKAHLNVILTDANGAETSLTLTTHYTVSDVGSATGSINLTAAGVALAITGTKLTILRNPPFTQETDLQNQGAYLAETVEDRFDLLTMQIQTVKERSDRSIAVPASDDATTIDELTADLVTVAGIAGDVSTVAANVTAVNTAATNIAAIIDAPNQATAAAGSASAAATSETNAGQSELDAQTAQQGAESARDTALSAVPDFNPVSLAAMKAGFNSSTHISAYLLDPDRGGQFVFRTGDFTAAIAADPAEGIAIKADATPTTTGALFRLYQGAVSVKWFGAKGDGVTDDRAACQAALNYVSAQGGGDVMFPDGDYRVVGVPVGTDPMATGIVIPHHSSLEAPPRIRIRGNGRSRVFAGSDGQILIRMSRAASEVTGLVIDGRCTVGGSAGDGYSNVWGIGMVAQDRSDTATLTSSSFCKVSRNVVTGCIEGIVQEPGPTVGASGAGCFYQYVGENDFNFNKRSVWLKPALNDGTNRPTRGMIFKNRITRGQGGVDIEYGTEISVIGNNFEFMQGATYGIDLHGWGFGIYVGNLSEFNWSDMNFMEQCDRHYAAHPSALPNALMISGDPLAGVSENVGFRPVVAQHIHRVTRRAAVYERIGFEAHHAAFGGLYFDWDGANVRDASIATNSTRRQSWGAGGGTTFYGTDGNIDILSNGRSVTCSAAFGLSFSATAGSVSFTANGGTSAAIFNAIRVEPIADNTTDLGSASKRYKVVYAGTGTINTSDAREKDWRGGLNEAELRIAKRLSKLVGIYRWKDAVAVKGDDARLHAGVTVQGVMAAFEAEGLDPFRYGMVCYDEWVDITEPVMEEREVVITDEDGQPIIDEETGKPLVEIRSVDTGETRVVTPAGNRYGLRYDELWAFVAAGFEARLVALEK